VGDTLVERFFSLSEETKEWAEYFREWLFREFLFRGMKRLSELPPYYVERRVARNSGGARVEVVSHGTAVLQLNWRRKITWFLQWLKYILKEAK
jgi:hypothetical protein